MLPVTARLVCYRSLRVWYVTSHYASGMLPAAAVLACYQSLRFCRVTRVSVGHGRWVEGRGLRGHPATSAANSPNRRAAGASGSLCQKPRRRQRPAGTQARQAALQHCRRTKNTPVRRGSVRPVPAAPTGRGAARKHSQAGRRRAWSGAGEGCGWRVRVDAGVVRSSAECVTRVAVIATLLWHWKPR